MSVPQKGKSLLQYVRREHAHRQISLLINQISVNFKRQRTRRQHKKIANRY
jgi:hypothetical protein